jgi:hypothetical protein
VIENSSLAIRHIHMNMRKTIRTRRLVATMRPLDAAMGYLVRRDKHVVNGGVVCAVGAWCGADALSSMFVD